MLRKFGRLVRALLKTAVILAFTGTVVPLVMVAVSLAIVLFTPVPITIPAKKVLPAQQASYVYDSTGNLLTIFRKVESNIPIQKSDIPRVLKQAIVAAEDRRFYTHNGVDAIGLVRAVKRDLETKEAEQGASTITQQLVKVVYYPDDDRKDVFEESASTIKRNANRLWRKLRIAVIANRLDRKKSKEDILFEYMSNIFLGNGANGVGAAAQTYFRKGVKDLTISEAATIAGIIPAPSKYEPRGNRSNAEFKRKTTLAQMRREGYITQIEYETAVAQELWIEEQGPHPGQAGHLCVLAHAVRHKVPILC